MGSDDPFACHRMEHFMPRVATASSCHTRSEGLSPWNRHLFLAREEQSIHSSKFRFFFYFRSIMLHDMQVPIDEPLATPVNPEKHKETEGLVVAQIYAVSSTTLPFSETYIPSRNCSHVS